MGTFFFPDIEISDDILVKDVSGLALRATLTAHSWDKTEEEETYTFAVTDFIRGEHPEKIEHDPDAVMMKEAKKQSAISSALISKEFSVTINDYTINDFRIKKWYPMYLDWKK